MGDAGFAGGGGLSVVFAKASQLLGQCNGLCGHFTGHLGPAYHHDRCERSVSMRLYSMHKRHLVALLAGFVISIGLAVIIGLAGPPITVTAGLQGSDVSNGSVGGPFLLASPLLSRYSQQLWLLAVLHTDTAPDETLEAKVTIAVTVDAVSEDHVKLPIVHAGHNRTRDVLCQGHECQPLILVHLGFLEHPHYLVQCTFTGLHHRLTEVDFYFKTYNPAFTQIEIWFRFIFLLSTFSMTLWFCYSLRQFAISDWSVEQKWISLLLPLLLLYNDPIFPLTFLVDFWIAGVLDATFQASFLSALLLFWLCMYHAIRQTERKPLVFYGPKLAVVGPMWMSAVTVAAKERLSEQFDPTAAFTASASNIRNIKYFFMVMLSIYVVYLVYLIIKAFTELRAMPFFGVRLKALTATVSIVAGGSAALAAGRYGPLAPLEDALAAQLTTGHGSSAHFMFAYSLLNLSVYAMAYVYAPMQRAAFDISITKDNPAFSMINDSDEDEVIYGSDEESRRPLNHQQRPDDDSD